MVLRYRPDLKGPSRKLRLSPTDSERLLWSKLRGKQILGVQFYRQKSLRDYVVDFYAPAANLVVEVDGAQHSQGDGKRNDKERDAYLKKQGLRVLRFDNAQVLKDTEAVLEVILKAVQTG